MTWPRSGPRVSTGWQARSRPAGCAPGWPTPASTSSAPAWATSGWSPRRSRRSPPSSSSPTARSSSSRWTGRAPAPSAGARSSGGRAASPATRWTAGEGPSPRSWGGWGRRRLGTGSTPGSVTRTGSSPTPSCPGSASPTTRSGTSRPTWPRTSRTPATSSSTPRPPTRRSRPRGGGSSSAAGVTRATRSPAFRSVPGSGRSFAGAGELVFDPAPLEARGIEPTLPDYLFTKVSGPERVLEGARMPTFGFAPEEAAAVTVALLSLKKDPLPAARTTRDPERPPYEPQGEFGALVEPVSLPLVSPDPGHGRHPLDRAPRSHRQPAPGGVHRAVPPEAHRGAGGSPGAHAPPEHRARRGAGPGRPPLHRDARRRPARRRPLRRARRSPGAGSSSTDTAAWGATSWATGAASSGPDLNGSGTRLKPGWTVAWLLDPERWKPGTLQPDHGLTREEAEALTAYTLSLPPRKGRATP